MEINGLKELKGKINKKYNIKLNKKVIEDFVLRESAIDKPILYIYNHICDRINSILKYNKNFEEYFNINNEFDEFGLLKKSLSKNPKLSFWNEK